MDYIQRCTERCTEPFWQRSKPQMCAAPIGGGSVGATARVRVAFLGNSIIYLPTAPAHRGHQRRCDEQTAAFEVVSFGQLMQRGNGGKSFRATRRPSVAALLSSSDFVVMNDFTQAPAREATRQEGIEVLRTQLAPLIARSGATPVLLQTRAYREVVKVGDLGDTSEFTRGWPRATAPTPPSRCRAACGAAPAHRAGRSRVCRCARGAARAVASALPPTASTLAARLVPRGVHHPHHHFWQRAGRRRQRARRACPAVGARA